MAFNEAQVNGGGQERPLASNTDQAMEKLQNDPSIAAQMGLNSDQVVDGLQAMLSKYECPMGLMTKLLDLQQFDVLDFIIDDSGSMNNVTDSRLPNGQMMTRWQEAISRLKTMIEIVSFVPINCYFPSILIARYSNLVSKSQGCDPGESSWKRWSDSSAIHEQYIWIVGRASLESAEWNNTRLSCVVGEYQSWTGP